MKTEKLITIKDNALNNHCPECFSKTLHIVFKQKFVETHFYKSVTNETVGELHCKTCNQIIYPIQWTDDIERVFEYHQRAFTPKKASLKLKRQAWILILVILAFVITVVIVPFLWSQQ